MKEFDCRGLSCPAPVITVKKAVETSSGDAFQVLLDNGAARENVLRYCRSTGCSVSEVIGVDSTILTITRNTHQVHSPVALTNQLPAAVILITSDRLGEGPDELGRLLLKNFVITLLEVQRPPEKIFFVNSGVLLTTEGSDLIEPLSKLANSGVEILSCGVCLEYYGISGKLAVGMTTNMLTIAESILTPGNGLRL